MPPHTPAIGSVLGGKYRVIDVLGKGGMGVVFRAQNTLTGKEVALKWINAPITASPESAQRLLREARAASRLNHPNVVNVFDVNHEGDTLFMVMELLEGETLRAYMERKRPSPIPEFLGLLLPAMLGVAAAHEKGVVHRDLKPDNIFLVRAGAALPVVKVVDFGIAKLTNTEGMTLTETGAAIGTPLYMSLEQLRADRDVDGRVDVYAFGVMLYEALTGRLPYTATTLTEFAIKVATTEPPRVKDLRPDVPTALALLVEWAIAKRREQRLPNMTRFIRELEVHAFEDAVRDSTPVLHARTSQAASAAPASSAPSTTEPEWDSLEATTLPKAARASERSFAPRLRSYRLGIGALLLAVLVTLLSRYFWSNSGVDGAASGGGAAPVTVTASARMPAENPAGAAAPSPPATDAIKEPVPSDPAPANAAPPVAPQTASQKPVPSPRRTPRAPAPPASTPPAPGALATPKIEIGKAPSNPASNPSAAVDPLGGRL